jgi:hypothetical protein
LIASETARAVVLAIPVLNAHQKVPISVDDQVIDGVGQFQCSSQNGQAWDYYATGWVAGSTDTVVTAAHLFYRIGLSGKNSGTVLNPESCVFFLFSRDQKVREIATIQYAVSPWAIDRNRFDSSFDFAVVKLRRRVDVNPIPITKVGVPTPTAAQLVARRNFSSKVPEITFGVILPFPRSQLRHATSNLSTVNADKLFATSASSAPGSSGGLYYDNKSGTAFGIHVGAVCDDSAVINVFNSENCFNFGIRFDNAMIKLVTAVSHTDFVPGEFLVSDRFQNRIGLFQQDRSKN